MYVVYKITLVFLVLTVFTGCTTIADRSLARESGFTGDKAYLFGRFELETNTVFSLPCGGGVGLQIYGPGEGSSIYTFDVENDSPGGVKAYEVEPGEYQIREWLALSSRTGLDKVMGVEAQTELTEPLTVIASPGTGYYLGDFKGYAECVCGNGNHCAYLTDNKDEFDRTKADLIETYPGLNGLPIESIR